MAEKLVPKIIGLFSGLTGIAFGKEILVFIISMTPILELRGGLIAASLLGLDPVRAYIISIIANIIPIPIILWFVKAVLDFMKNHNIMEKFVLWLEEKVNSKKESIEKAEFWGLLLFVGIPLPGTGAWTGCLIAALLGIEKKKAFLAATLGVIMASIIMMFLSYGVLGAIIG